MPQRPSSPSLRFHWLRLRATAHATEDPQKVAAALRFASGLGEEEFAPLLLDTALEGHHGGAVHLLEVTLPKSRQARDVLERILALQGAREALAATVEPRTDDEGVFYVRLDKQKAFGGVIELTSGEDCVQLRFRAEVYPTGKAATVAAWTARLAPTPPPPAP